MATPTGQSTEPSHARQSGGTVELSVADDVLRALMDKAHEFHVKTAVVELDPGSNPADDGQRGVLEDYPDDPIEEELTQLLSDLNQDQLGDLVALMWLGRGDFDPSQWREKRAEALALDARHTPSYLIGTPLLADYLEEGLAALGR